MWSFFSGPYFPVFELNTGEKEPEKTPYLAIFRAVEDPSDEKNYHKCSLFDKNLHVICKGVLVTSSKFKNRQKIFSICYLLKPYRKRCYETRK